MLHKGYYISVVLLAMCGIAISIAIKPREDELAFMNFKDKRFSEAYSMFEEQWKNGDRSKMVIMTLSKLYLQYGKVTKAINIMEDFIRKFPNALDAREQIGIFYQYDQRPDDYLRNLEVIYRMKPTGKVLHELSDLYNFFGEYDKQINILDEIIANYKAEEDDYIKLVYLYAAKKEYQKAANVIDIMFNSLGSNITAQLVEFSVSVLVDSGHRQMAEKIALDYTKIFDDPILAVRLAEIMNSKGASHEAMKLLNPFADRMENDPKLLSAVIEINISVGENKKAFKRLLDIYEKAKLDDILVNQFVKLALKEGDEKLLLDIIQNLEMELLPENILLSFAEKSLVLHKPEIAAMLKESLGKEFIDASITIDAALSLAAEENGSKEKILDPKVVIPFSSSRMITLAKISVAAGLNDLALRIMSSFRAEHIREETAQDLVELYMKLKKEKVGEGVFRSFITDENMQNNKYTQYIHRGWVILAAASGYSENVIKWVKKNNETDKIILTDIYFAAADYKVTDLSLFISRRLYALDKTDDKSRRYLAEALLLNRKYDESLKWFRELVKKQQPVYDSYVEALVGMIREKGTTKKLENELEYFLEFRVAKGSLSKKQRRDIAFILLKYGFKDNAEEIFLKLAENASPDSKDVENLMHLWGPRPKYKAVKWLENMVVSTGGKRQVKWLRKFLNIGQENFIIQTIESDVIDSGKEEVVDLYMESLRNKKEKVKFANVIRKEAENTRNHDRLKKLASIAMEENLQDIAKNIYVRILEKSPDDVDTLRKLGVLSFFKGHYKMSEKYFKKLFERTNGDYATNYYFGELKLRKKELKQAIHHFKNAISQIESLEKQSIKSRKMYASVLSKLGRSKKAISVLQKLYDEYPNNKDLQTDFANLLIDNGYYKKARRVVF